MPEKTALITGAAHGIGFGIARRLALENWRVVIADRDRDGGRAAAAEIGPAAFFENVDVADESAVNSLVSRIDDRFGRLDGMVCNAGFMVRKPVTQLSLTEWRSVIDTNLTSTFLLTRAATPLLHKHRGSIVTIASTRAHQSEPDTESYAASKGGLLALTHALAISLGPGIRVNCCSPGWIDVEKDTLRPQDHAQHPAGRVGRPDDIAALVAWLLGPDSGYVTGAEFIVDGGMTRKMIYLE